jgi:glucosamine-6-phosphate deaminase
MSIRVFPTADEMYDAILAQNILQDKVILLPTGSTAIGLYQKIKTARLDLSGTTTFNLDEYYPIERTNPLSYHAFMYKNLFNEVNILPENIHLLNGETDDPKTECVAYGRNLVKKGIDIAFLGLGLNGHIAFNEPGSTADSTTRVVELSATTKDTNKVPFTTAMSVGLSEILSSKKIIIMATGFAKAEIVYQCLSLTTKNYRPDLPATILMGHPNVEFYLDDPAFSKVNQK